MKERYLTAAIYPTGIGISGIFIKTFNSIYPRKWSTSISATNPIDAAHKIIDYINGIKKSMEENWYSLKAVVVELPFENLKDEKEIKATSELIGILRYEFETKFKGHLTSAKDKNLLEELKSKKKTVQERNAEAIMYAHFKEKEKNWVCEDAWWKKHHFH